MLLHHVLEGRRPAVEDDRVLPGCRELLLDEVSRDEADAVAPAALGLHVHCVVQFEAVRVVLLELVKLVSQQDVVHCAVAENQRYRRTIVAVERSLKHLIAWGDACAACNHADPPLLDNLLLDEELAEALVSKLSIRPTHEHLRALV